MADIQFCVCIVQIIYILIGAAAISVVALVYSATSENPLEKFDEKYPDIIPKPLQTSPQFQLYKDEEKYCQCGDQILDNICTEEQIISGCYDISKYKEKALIRNLEDDEYRCKELDASLRSKGKFSTTFELGYGTVHNMALGLLICMSVVLAINVIVNLLNCCSPEAAKACNSVYTCISELGNTAELVLVCILLVNFYKGTTTGEFLDFYEKCSESNDYKNTAPSDFKDVYEKLSKAHTYMTAWIVLGFAALGMGCVLGCCIMICVAKLSSG